MLYYIEDYYTDDIINTATDFDHAVDICKDHEGSMVTDENDNVYYTNIDIPF